MVIVRELFVALGAMIDGVLKFFSTSFSHLMVVTFSGHILATNEVALHVCRTFLNHPPPSQLSCAFRHTQSHVNVPSPHAPRSLSSRPDFCCRSYSLVRLTYLTNSALSSRPVSEKRIQTHLSIFSSSIRNLDSCRLPGNLADLIYRSTRLFKGDMPTGMKSKQPLIAHLTSGSTSGTCQALGWWTVPAPSRVALKRPRFGAPIVTNSSYVASASTS